MSLVDYAANFPSPDRNDKSVRCEVENTNLRWRISDLERRLTEISYISKIEDCSKPELEILIKRINKLSSNIV